MITAPQILEFLCKAQQLNMQPNLKQTDKGYEIQLFYNWYGNIDFHTRTVFISSQGASSWEEGDVTFESMNTCMDIELDKLKAKEAKEQKRNELIARLTDEEKELLGVS